MLARKMNEQKLIQEAARYKLELEMSYAEREVLRTRESCYAAMVSVDQDVKSIETITQLKSVWCKGMLVEGFLR